MKDKIYDGAQLHGVYKPQKDQFVEPSTIDLGNTPEDVVTNEVSPIITKLNDILNKYNVYIWTTMGYHSTE